ncbi:MAG: hypothetical protein IJX18_00555, partial [Clostridia bacterium]|nr:hypothetical protein [Clostridia bacterium]
MKKVKISYVGVYKGFDYQIDKIYKILCAHYEVEIVKPEEAEYIICSSFDEKYDYCKYPQIRIMYVAENYIPDLNLIDYAVCTYPVQLVDRC